MIHVKPLQDGVRTEFLFLIFHSHVYRDLAFFRPRYTATSPAKRRATTITATTSDSMSAAHRQCVCATAALRRLLDGVVAN